MSTSAITHISTPTNPILTAPAEGRFSKGTVAIAAAVAIITGVVLAIFEVISWTVLASAGASLATCYIISLAMKQPDAATSPAIRTPLSSAPTSPRQDPLQPANPPSSSSNLTVPEQNPSTASTLPQPMGSTHSSTPTTHVTPPQLPISTTLSPIGTPSDRTPPRSRKQLFARSLSLSSMNKPTPQAEVRFMITQVQNSPARIKKQLLPIPREESGEGSPNISPTLQRRSPLNLTSSSASFLGSSTPLATASFSQMASTTGATLSQTSTPMPRTPERSPPTSPREGSEADREESRAGGEITKAKSTLRDQFPSPLDPSKVNPLVTWRRDIEKLYTNEETLLEQIVTFIDSSNRTPDRCNELKGLLADQERQISEKLTEKRLHLTGANFRVFTAELVNRVRRLNELLESI